MRPGGAYAAFGARYSEVLARSGITVRLRETAGSVENLSLLKSEDGADIAFVQSGLGGNAQDGDVVAVGAVFLEPLWVFLRQGFSAASVPDLEGARIAVGPDGSGTQAIALALLEINGFDRDNSDLRTLPQTEVTTAIAAGDVDAAFVVCCTDFANRSVAGGAAGARTGQRAPR